MPSATLLVKGGGISKITVIMAESENLASTPETSDQEASYQEVGENIAIDQINKNNFNNNNNVTFKDSLIPKAYLTLISGSTFKEPERRNFVKNVTVLSEDSEVVMFRADE